MELKRTWKRIIAGFLTFVMAFCFVPNIPALAAGSASGSLAASIGTIGSHECYYGESGLVNTSADNNSYSAYYTNHDDCYFGEAYYTVSYTPSVSGLTYTESNSNKIYLTFGYNGNVHNKATTVNVGITGTIPTGTYTFIVYQPHDTGVHYPTGDGVEMYRVTYTVKRRPITIVATSIDQIYGQYNNSITYNWTVRKSTSNEAADYAKSGLVGSDTIASICTQVYATGYKPTGTSDTTTVSGVVTNQAINQYTAGSNAKNYDIHMIPATLNIRKRPITITANEINKYYGEDNKVITYTFGYETSNTANTRGLYSGDSISDVCKNVYASQYPNKPAATTNQVAMTKHMDTTIDSYTEGNKTGNYTVTLVPARLNINQVPLGQVTVDYGKTFKTYDGTDFTTAPQFSYQGKALRLDEGTDYTLYWKKEGNDKQYKYPNTAGKYTAIFEAKVGQDDLTGDNKGTNFTVNKKALTISPKAQTIVYGQNVSYGLNDPSGANALVVDGLAETDKLNGYTLIFTPDDKVNGTYTKDTDGVATAGTRTISFSKDNLVIVRTDGSVYAEMISGAYDEIVDSYAVTEGEDALLTVSPYEDYIVTATGFTGNYDKQAHGIVVNVSGLLTDTELTVKYRYKTGESDWSEWSETNPTFTDVGVYTVQYRVAEDTVNYQTKTGERTVTINAVSQNADVFNPNPATVAIQGWTYGDTPNAPVVKEEGENGRDITAAISDTNDAKPVIKYAENHGGVPPLPNSEAWSETVPTQAGNYWISATIPAYGNYAETFVTSSFTIAKKDITVAINNFTQYYDEYLVNDNYNAATYAARYPESKKFVVTGLVGDDTIADDVITVSRNGVALDAAEALDTINAKDALANYNITAITPGTVTYKQIALASAQGVYNEHINVVLANDTNVVSEGVRLYEWGLPVLGVTSVSINVYNAADEVVGDPIVLSSTDDYDVYYLSLDPNTLEDVVLDQAPTAVGTYALVIQGKNVAPGEANENGAKVYSKIVIPFKITTRQIKLTFSADDRDYKYTDTNVDLTLTSAVYSNGHAIEDEVRNALVADPAITGLKGVMTDDAVGHNKIVTINGDNQALTLGTFNPASVYTILLDNTEVEDEPCKAKVDIYPVHVPTVTFKIGASEETASATATWQYGDYDASTQATFVNATYQTAGEGEEAVEDSSNEGAAVRYYCAVGDSTYFEIINLGANETIQTWLASRTPNTYKVKAGIVAKENGNYTTTISDPITVTVTKRKLKVVANEQYRYYMDDVAFVKDVNGVLPAPNPTVEGYTEKKAYTIVHVKGENSVDPYVGSDANVVVGNATCSVTTVRTMAAGDYAIEKGTIAIAAGYQDRYELDSFEAGTFKILPLPLDNAWETGYPSLTGRTVQVQLEKNEYVYDRTEKTPDYNIVYANADGSESSAIPVEQYKASYTLKNTSNVVNPKEPGDYQVYVIRADGKNNLKNSGAGVFVIKPIAVTVTVAGSVDGTRVYDGTKNIVDAQGEKLIKTTNVVVLAKTNEDTAPVAADSIADTTIKGQLQEITNSTNYAAAINGICLSSKNAGEYSSSKKNIDASALEALSNDYFEFKAEFAGTYNVTKKPLTQGMVDVAEGIVYDGTEKTPVTLVDGNPSIITSDDYTVTYSNNGVAGNAAYVVEATEAGNYTGTLDSSTFPIAPKELTVISTLALSEKEYNGNATMALTGGVTVTGINDGDNAKVVVKQVVGETETVIYDSVTGLAENAKVTVDSKNVGNNRTATLTVAIVPKEEATETNPDKSASYKLAEGGAEIALTGGKIKPVNIEVDTSELKLKNRRYNGEATMELVGDVAYEGFVEGDAAALKIYNINYVDDEHEAEPEATLVFNGGQLTDAAKTIPVDSANVGDKEAEFMAVISGVDAGNYTVSIAEDEDDDDDDEHPYDSSRNGSFDEISESSDVRAMVLPSCTFTLCGHIYEKEIILYSGLALKDKEYDGNADMQIVGDYEFIGAKDGEDVSIKFTDMDGNVLGEDNDTITVSQGSDVGTKEDKIKAELTGDDAGNYYLTLGDIDELPRASANENVRAIGDEDDDVDDEELSSWAYVPVTGDIYAKDITVTSTLALTDKAYDGNTKMTVKGAATLKGVVGNDDVSLAGIATTVNVANASAGDKSYTFNFTLAGAKKGNYNLVTKSATAKGKIISTGTLTEKGIFCMQVQPEIVAGMVVEKSNANDVVEYRWEAMDADHPENGWFEVSSWKKGNEWLRWRPSKAGNYVIVGHARIVGNPKTEVTSSFGTPYKVIKGIAQLPNAGGGFLIGLETYDNPNQSYRYELLILDCTLYAQGLPAWIYTTNPQTVASGNSFWTVWQPKYGYYWTLFRVYDAQGNLVDEEVFGFTNAQ